MKRFVLSLLALAITYAMSGCSRGASPTPTGAARVEDQASLLEAFRNAGATVEVGETLTQDFFTPEAHLFTVNGQGVQVFEYASAEAMEGEASQVAPDGGSVGTSMVTWMDAPHFYKSGRVIVLYVGSDKTLLDLLNKVIGPQFAGQ